MVKRILIPAYDFKPALGGVANYVHEVATSWVTLGHDVVILARAQDGDLAFDSSVPYKVLRIKTPQTALLTLPHFARNIRALSASYKPDFIYCPLWFPDGASVYLSKVYQKIPFFMAVHASEIFLLHSSVKQTIRSTLLRLLQKSVFTNVKKVFAVSHYTKMITEKQTSINSSQIVVVNNGVNPKIFHPKDKTLPEFLSLLQDKKILLTVTRLHPYKGVDSVLQALPYVLQHIPDAHYLVVGSGPDQDRLQQIAKQLSITKHVTFLGNIPYEKIVDLYNISTLFVLLSREELPDVEGFGLVFLEAAACGLPSLGGHSGGVPDAIDDMRSGWLVDPQSPDKIQKKLVQLLSAPQILNEASEYCLKTAPQKTWLTCARTILESIYEN